MSSSKINEILSKINISPDDTDHKEQTKVLITLIQFIENLSQDNKSLKEENQELRDEISLLKGEQGKPKIRGNKKPNKDISSEKEIKKRDFLLSY